MGRRAGYGAKRASIIAAALQVLRDEGYEAVTVDRVLAVAKISKGTFYHYFSAKEELVEAAVLNVVEDLMAAILAEVSRRTGAAATERLSALLSLVRPWADVNDLANRALAGMLLRTPELEALRTRVFDTLTRGLTPAMVTVLEDGARAGEFDVADPPVTAQLLVLLALSTRARILATLIDAAPGGEPRVVAARWTDGFLRIVERTLGLPTPTLAEGNDGIIQESPR